MAQESGYHPPIFFFLPHLGVIPIKNSKLIPGIGRDNTERYSSSKRLLTVPFKDKSAQRSENPFFKGYVAHEIGWEVSRIGYSITRHCITFAIVTPFIKKPPNCDMSACLIT